MNEDGSERFVSRSAVVRDGIEQHHVQGVGHIELGWPLSAVIEVEHAQVIAVSAEVVGAEVAVEDAPACEVEVGIDDAEPQQPSGACRPRA